MRATEVETEAVFVCFVPSLEETYPAVGTVGADTVAEPVTAKLKFSAS